MDVKPNNRLKRNQVIGTRISDDLAEFLKRKAEELGFSSLSSFTEQVFIAYKQEVEANNG